MIYNFLEAQLLSLSQLQFVYLEHNVNYQHINVIDFKTSEESREYSIKWIPIFFFYHIKY